jgi:hypothetical protein
MKWFRANLKVGALLRLLEILPILLAAVVIAYLSYAATTFTALKDYFLYVAEYTNGNFGPRLLAQFALGAYLYFLFATLYYDLVMNQYKPQPANSHFKLIFDRIARLVVILSPTFAFWWLLFDAAVSNKSRLSVLWLAIFAISLSAILQFALTFADLIDDSKLPIRMGKILLFTRRLVSRRTTFLVLATTSVFAIYIWMWTNVISATTFIGGTGIICLFLIALLLVVHLIIRYPRIIALLILFVVISHIFAPRAPEFTHTASSLPSRPPVGSPVRIAESAASNIDTEKQANRRGVPSLSESFEQWLRSRPNYLRVKSEGKKYPVFIVAAQGGGEYAAYHTAMSLARLYGSCPMLKNHLFAISSISGGSFGAGVFTELLRASPSLGDSCSVVKQKGSGLEQSVRDFFSNDFVTPVISTGLFFDLPRLLFPWLYVMDDRARTLELAFDRALRSKNWAQGTSFYSRWSPSENVPREGDAGSRASKGCLVFCRQR